MITVNISVICMIIEQIFFRVNKICYFTTLFLSVDYYSTYLALMVNSILGLYCCGICCFVAFSRCDWADVYRRPSHDSHCLSVRRIEELGIHRIFLDMVRDDLPGFFKRTPETAYLE